MKLLAFSALGLIWRLTSVADGSPIKLEIDIAWEGSELQYQGKTFSCPSMLFTYSSLPNRPYLLIKSYIGPKSEKILNHTHLIRHTMDHFLDFNKPYLLNTEDQVPLLNYPYIIHILYGRPLS